MSMDEKAKTAASAVASSTIAKVENTSEITKDSALDEKDWKNLLQITPKGKIMMTPGNLIMISLEESLRLWQRSHKVY